MMKMRKVFAAILSIVLCLSVFPICAVAEDFAIAADAAEVESGPNEEQQTGPIFDLPDQIELTETDEVLTEELAKDADITERTEYDAVVSGEGTDV